MFVNIDKNNCKTNKDITIKQVFFLYVFLLPCHWLQVRCNLHPSLQIRLFEKNSLQGLRRIFFCIHCLESATTGYTAMNRKLVTHDVCGNMSSYQEDSSEEELDIRPYAYAEDTIQPAQSNMDTEEVPSRDVCGNMSPYQEDSSEEDGEDSSEEDLDVRPEAYAEGTITQSAQSNVDTTADAPKFEISLPDNGNYHRYLFIYSKYISYQARLMSFKKWVYKTPAKDLSDAGFFFSGTDDIVVCFSCGIHVRDWKTKDPWVEHERLGEKKCSYLNMRKAAAVKHKESPNKEYKIPCIICEDAESCILYLPCSHLHTCAKCTYAKTHCSVCDSNINVLAIVYYP